MIVILAGGVLGPATGCGSEPTPPPATGQPSRTPEAGAGPASSSGSGPVPSTGSGTTGPPPSAPAATPTPPPGPGELPGGLPHGERTLTGVVERSGECTLLRVGARRWGLTGTPIDELADGSRVTVVGQVTTGAECAGQDVVRTLIVRRVTPG